MVDVNLGRDSGIAAVEAICAVLHIPCIFVGGGGSVLAMLALRGEVMAKPYQQRHLKRAIAGALGAWRGPARELGYRSS